MDIVSINQQNMADIPKREQPYTVIGEIVPRLENGVWTYTETYYSDSYEKTFPEEDHALLSYMTDPTKAAFLAYDNGTFAGAVRLQCDWNRYAFIHDIGVEKAFRRQGAGALLMARAEAWAKEKGMQGLALEAQTIILIAAKFYQKCGFTIGAVNTMLYRNLGLDEIAVFWYKCF